jgi:hypothetical protein
LYNHPFIVREEWLICYTGGAVIELKYLADLELKAPEVVGYYLAMSSTQLRPTNGVGGVNANTESERSSSRPGIDLVLASLT